MPSPLRSRQGGDLGRPGDLAVELDGAVDGLDLHRLPALAVAELGERPLGARRPLRHPPGGAEACGLPHRRLPLQPLAGVAVRLLPGVRRFPLSEGGEAGRALPGGAQRGAGLRLDPHPGAARSVRPPRSPPRPARRDPPRSPEAGAPARPRALLRPGGEAAGGPGADLPGHVPAERRLRRPGALPAAGRR